MAGRQEGLGDRKGAPKQKGADCPTGRGAKGTSEERNSEGAGRAVLSPPGHSDGGRGAAACPPLALGEPATREPWARQAPSGTRTTAPPPAPRSPFPRAPLASPLRTWGSATPHSPPCAVAPTPQGQGSRGNSRVESRCGKVGGPAATPIRNTKKKKKSASKVKSSQSENISSNSP